MFIIRTWQEKLSVLGNEYGKHMRASHNHSLDPEHKKKRAAALLLIDPILNL